MLLSKKVVLAFVLMFITVVIGLFFYYEMTMTMEHDKSIINRAGRQRMLIQKYARELMQEILPKQIRHSAIKTAKIATQQIIENRKYYTKNVIEKLNKDGVVEVHPNYSYIKIDGGIPLPATFVNEVSNNISENGMYSYNLLSKWNINKEKGLRTDIEKEAFSYLFVNKDSVFKRFEVDNGRYLLHYATADIASASACVSCHNNQEESPKKDFKLGDLMGILMVTIPISATNSETSPFFKMTTDQNNGGNTSIKTRKEFDITLDALIRGTNAHLGMYTRRFSIFPTITNPAIKSKLMEVQEFWYTAQEDFDKLLLTTPNSMEYILVYNEANGNINNAVVAMNEVVNMYQARSDRRASLLMWWIIGGYLGATLLFIIIGWNFVNKHILLPISKLSSGTKLVTEDKLDNDIEVKSRDEVGMLTKNFNNMIYSMRKSRAHIEKNNWIKSGQAVLFEKMQGDNDITRLGENVITYLAEYLNAEVGIIYMAVDCSTLKTVGSYAYSKPHNHPDSFKFGEGLAGQAALERKTILTTDIPEDYIKIDTGWSKAIPRHILIAPLIFMGGVKGVVELGSHNNFTDTQLEFLNAVTKNIAVVFSTTKSHFRDKVPEHLELEANN